MKIAYFKSLKESSVYFHPFKWKNLSDLFPGSTLCSVELFVGYKNDVSYSCDRNDSSPELNDFRIQALLKDMFSIIKRNKIVPYEFKITISNIKIASLIGGGCVFTGTHELINELLPKLGITQAILNEAKNKLISIEQNEVITQEGQFIRLPDLMDFIYDEVMESEVPGYKNIDSPF